MLEQTFRKSLWLVFILAVPFSVPLAKVPQVDVPQVTVSVHNDAGVPPEILMQAESQASRVFRHSGLETLWLNCPLSLENPQNPAHCGPADFPRHLQLRIAKNSLNLNEFALGISYLSADGIGCYADLFYERAWHLHQATHVDLASILGHAFAHEIGHLLLGTNSHSPTGLMRARWQPADLVSASQGILLFSTQESQQMRNKLSAWHARERDTSRVPTARLGDSPVQFFFSGGTAGVPAPSLRE